MQRLQKFYKANTKVMCESSACAKETFVNDFQIALLGKNAGSSREAVQHKVWGDGGKGKINYKLQQYKRWLKRYSNN